MKKSPSTKKEYGNYVVLNGKQLTIRQHPTDFSVLAAEPDIQSQAEKRHLKPTVMGKRMMRLAAPNSNDRDTSMAEIRKKMVAHHIYLVEGTDEELVIDDRICLRLRRPDPTDLQNILDEFHLTVDGRMGETHVLKLTDATGMNPIRAANSIAQRPEVLSAAPQVMVPVQRHQLSFSNTHQLFREQWYLTADLINHVDVDPRAGIQAPEAWQITRGKPNIVIAIQDDGYDQEHPAFQNKTIHSAAKDFAESPSDSDPSEEGEDFHGTPVASIATSSLGGGVMVELHLTVCYSLFE